MNNNIYVVTVCPETREMLISIAKRNNWKTKYTDDMTVDLVIYNNHRSLGGNHSVDNSWNNGKFERIDVNKAVAILKTQQQKVLTTWLEEYKVEVRPGQSIKVGCQMLDKNKVEEIIKLWSEQ